MPRNLLQIAIRSLNEVLNINLPEKFYNSFKVFERDDEL